jgi:hypothetical protein
MIFQSSVPWRSCVSGEILRPDPEPDGAEALARPHSGLSQPRFVCTMADPLPTMVVVVEDLVTSGRTVRLSVEAARTWLAGGMTRGENGHGYTNK